MINQAIAWVFTADIVLMLVVGFLAAAAFLFEIEMRRWADRIIPSAVILVLSHVAAAAMAIIAHWFGIGIW
jgi:hypothetical protein